MATSFPTFTDLQRVSDFLKWEVEPRYCRKAVRIKNTATAALGAGDLQPGAPLLLNGSTWEVAQGAEANTVDGFLVDANVVEAIASGATSVRYYQVLVRGPAIINKSALPATDPDGAAYTLATLVTAAEALLIQTFVEPTTEEEQTT